MSPVGTKRTNRAGLEMSVVRKIGSNRPRVKTALFGPKQTLPPQHELSGIIRIDDEREAIAA
jgi:hypothetical protein